MATCAERTTIIQPDMTRRPIVAPMLRWPQADVAENLDWTLDVTVPLADANDQITTVSLALAPSGTGERTISSLALNGTTITAQLAGGLRGRNYLNQFTVTGLSGRIWRWRVNQFISPIPYKYPVPLPPSWNYGTPTVTTVNGILTVYGSILALSFPGNWPTSGAGLLPGALYAASTPGASYIYAVPGFGPVDLPPVYYGVITAPELLARTAVGLPQTDPHNLNQIWINGNLLCVSLG